MRLILCVVLVSVFTGPSLQWTQGFLGIRCQPWLVPRSNIVPSRRFNLHFRRMPPVTCLNSKQRTDGSEAVPFNLVPIDAVDQKGKVSAIKLSNETISRLQSKFGVTRLAPIQTETFAAIMGDRDILARSHTGSGKTLAFCLPLVETLRRRTLAKDASTVDLAEDESASPQILIMLPTRELALQVARVLRLLGGNSIRCVAAVGGTALDPQVGRAPPPPPPPRSTC
jgi:hypothetical protein